MTKVAEFVYELNRTKPPNDIENAVFAGVWDAGKVTVRLVVGYKTKLRLGVTWQEIEQADDMQALAIEVAERMVKMYRDKMAMPLLEGK